MLPNNNELMYRYALTCVEDFHRDAKSLREQPLDTHAFRRRLAIAVGIGLVGLILVVTLVGWLL